MALSLVSTSKNSNDDGKQKPPPPPDDRLKQIRAEVEAMLLDRIENLRREAEKLHGTMEQVLYRISAQGVEVKLDDLKTGKWYRLKTEITTLQEVLVVMDSVD